uniref:Uncharacterized protein n=1 Tax=Arundo donax TaxID=35708 RepID=A0A0A9H2W7_ARUDO
MRKFTGRRPWHCENYVNQYIESLCYMYMSCNHFPIAMNVSTSLVPTINITICIGGLCRRSEESNGSPPKATLW